ncbi:MAG: hypothetical protein ACK5EO_13715 [Planctomycetota bacterium]|jgi:hypothetical protein
MTQLTCTEPASVGAWGLKTLTRFTKFGSSGDLVGTAICIGPSCCVLMLSGYSARTRAPNEFRRRNHASA